MNNIAQHFVTAWLGKYLGGDSVMAAYLDLIPNANDGVFSQNKDGSFNAEHSHLKGFQDRTAKGLRFETLVAAE